MVLIIGLNERFRHLARRLIAVFLVHGWVTPSRPQRRQAEISLDLLAGYTSFVRRDRCRGAAGSDLIHRPAYIAPSLAVLAAMGVNPLDGAAQPFRRSASDLVGGTWSVCSTSSVLPLDGGHSTDRSRSPRRARRGWPSQASS
jgi:hypothetical protein